MARFSVSGGEDENNEEEDVGTSSRRPLPKRLRRTTTLRISTFARSPLASSIRRTEPIISLDQDSTDESDNSSSHYTNTTSDSEQPLFPQDNQVVTLSDTDVLDCPICLDPLTNPVFQCENGHLACGSCCNKIRNKCPSCVMPIGYNRCRGMEKVLEAVKTSCQNRQYGCVQKISYCHKLDHEKSCKYAPCSCPNDGCNFVGISTRLYHHVFTRHVSTNFRFNTIKLCEIFKRDTHIVLQEGKQKTVFVLNHVIEPLGSLINIICVAPTSSNMKFSYDLTAALDGNLIKLESSMAVTPKFIAQSFPEKKFLLVTSDFFDRDGKLRLELVIKRLN